MRKGLEPRLPPTATVARHITPDTAPSLQTPLARQPIIHPLPTMGIIRPRPWPITKAGATTALRLGVPLQRALWSAWPWAPPQPLPRPAQKARAPTMQATQLARPTRALPTPTLRLRMLMRRPQTPMRRPRTPIPPLRTRVLRAPPMVRIRWVQFMRRYLPAASVPRYREAEPTICAATPGSVRPMVRTG